MVPQSYLVLNKAFLEMYMSLINLTIILIISVSTHVYKNLNLASLVIFKKEGTISLILENSWSLIIFSFVHFKVK